jgi:hypothetical protein
LIGTRSANSIRASGHMRRTQRAGHMTAPDQAAKTMLKTLARGGRPHMIYAPSRDNARRLRRYLREAATTRRLGFDFSPGMKHRNARGDGRRDRSRFPRGRRSLRFLNHLLFENRKLCYSVWIGSDERAPFEGLTAALEDGKEFFV